MKKFVVASAALLGAVTMLACGESVAQQSITISSWGGAFQKAQREAWFNVVEKELGITIKEDTTSGVADIRAQVASGRPTWDLSTQGAHTCGILEKEGKLEKLDAAIVNDAGVPKELKSRVLDLADRLFRRHRLAHQGLRRQEAGRLGGLLGHQEFPGPALHAAPPRSTTSRPR